MDKIDAVLILMFLIFFAFSVFIYFQLQHEGVQCISNPILYGIKSIEKKVDARTTCTINIMDKHYAPFIVSTNGTYPIEILSNSSKYYQINVTELGKIISK